MKKTSKPLRVAVLMGGPSAEHAVSLGSGTEVVRALADAGHVAVPILLSKKQTWHLLSPSLLLDSRSDLHENSELSQSLENQSTAMVPFGGVEQTGVDVVFIAMHGATGEDGKIQALLEMLGLPYTGSGVLASALSMDKVQFRRVMKAEHILIPESCTFTNESYDEIATIVKSEIGEPPYVVKPSDQGSSIGVSLVHDWHQLEKAVSVAKQKSHTILIDRYIKGREFTVGVLGTDEPLALPVTEIIPDGEFFDYHAKYLSVKMNDICPADISKELSDALQSLSVHVFNTVGAEGFARVDFIVDEQSRPYVLEINTIPGLTPVSLLPIAAKTAGISFPELIDTIVQDSLRKKKENQLSLPTDS